MKNNKRYKSHELAAKYSLSQDKSDELEKLLTDMKVLRFSSSSDLSKYIKNKKLGEKYPNISGIVKMKDEGREWDFEGGFPKNIYRIICKELSLENQHTTAQAIGFKSYKDL